MPVKTPVNSEYKIKRLILLKIKIFKINITVTTVHYKPMQIEKSIADNELFTVIELNNSIYKIT